MKGFGSLASCPRLLGSKAIFCGVRCGNFRLLPFSGFQVAHSYRRASIAINFTTGALKAADVV